MKRTIVAALLSMVALCAAVSLTSCKKDTLEYVVENSDWVGTYQMVYMDDTVEVKDNVTLSLTFSKNNCRLSGKVEELRDEQTAINKTIDTYGTYTYDKSEGVIKSDATVLSGGTQFTFRVSDASKLTLSVPAGYLLTTSLSMDLQQRSSLEY